MTMKAHRRPSYQVALKVKCKQGRIDGLGSEGERSDFTNNYQQQFSRVY